MYKEKIDTLACLCPPTVARPPTNLVAYRLVENTPPTQADFDSHALVKGPKKRPRDIDECHWHSCSLFKEIRQLEKIAGLPNMKGIKKAIVEVTLDSTSGLIETSSRGHVDWWAFTAFDVLKNCKIAKPLP